MIHDAPDTLLLRFRGSSRLHTQRVVHRIAILLDTEKPITGAEVGVEYGRTSQIILEAFPKATLYMIDAWQSRIGTDRQGRSVHRRNKKQSHDIANAFPRRAVIVEGLSCMVAWQVPNDLDFVYLDADHSYEAVLVDLATWWQKIRVGGILMGHDYNGRGDRTGRFGVKKAVDYFCTAHGLRLFPRAGFFWIVKGEPRQ